LLRAHSVAAHLAEANCLSRSSQYFFQVGTAGARLLRALLLSLAGHLLLLMFQAGAELILRLEEVSNCFFIFDLRHERAKIVPPGRLKPFELSKIAQSARFSSEKLELSGGVGALRKSLNKKLLSQR
jgi:hypothetical protein